MSLPPLIEIIPLNEAVAATVTVPGSKSITNRALVLAALASAPVKLCGALWSEDTQVMAAALRLLGFEITVQPDPKEPGNRHITVQGMGGRIPGIGTAERPLDLFVGNAGTAARFLAALCCLGEGTYRLHGVPRMHERPQGSLFRALRDLGYRIDAASDHLPALIHGTGPKPGANCTVSIDESSQFASALMLCGGAGEWKIAVDGENSEESPYVHMTSELIRVFPSEGGEFSIEPDASSGSYFWAADWLMAAGRESGGGSGTGVRCLSTDAAVQIGEPSQLASIRLRNWPASNWQIDQQFPLVMSRHPSSVSRERELGDSILTAIVLAPLLDEPVRFTDLGRLRVQECERVVALRTELTRCGARVTEAGDTLTVYPSKLHGAAIETYNDHRMAMCFAILGLKVPGIRIHNPACVRKTFPNFFQKLATPPSQGLGVRILEGRGGRKLEGDELFAE